MGLLKVNQNYEHDRRTLYRYNAMNKTEICTEIRHLKFLSFNIVLGAERCQFPEEWRGRWYQGGLEEVVIKDTAISKKGVCRTHHNAFYVLEDR